MWWCELNRSFLASLEMLAGRIAVDPLLAGWDTSQVVAVLAVRPVNRS